MGSWVGLGSTLILGLICFCFLDPSPQVSPQTSPLSFAQAFTQASWSFIGLIGAYLGIGLFLMGVIWSTFDRRGFRYQLFSYLVDPSLNQTLEQESNQE
jgi:hypothetical protein